MSNLWPVGHMQPRMAVNVAQHKIAGLLKTLWGFFMITYRDVFNVWPKTTLLLPLWCSRHQKAGHPCLKVTFTEHCLPWKFLVVYAVVLKGLVVRSFYRKLSCIRTTNMLFILLFDIEIFCIVLYSRCYYFHSHFVCLKSCISGL